MSAKHRILIVDDEPLNVKLLEAILSSDSYEFSRDFNSEQALEKVSEECPDLIFLDARPQGEECFEICRRLKEREQTANTQILVVADSEYLETNHEQFELWCDDFLIKPINVHEVRSRVKALVKKKTFLDRIYVGTEGSVHSAITDSLSGLANNSYLKYFLSHEIKRSLRDSRPLTLVMMELKDVKHNPNYMGHPAGEELIKDLGTLIKENIRDVDLGARYKEQQFAMVLINTDGNGPMKVADRLKGLIKNYFSKNTENISAESPTLNIGIAAYPSDAESMESLINHAAKELSESKNKIHPPTHRT
jgi:diguanylate cyclase (GGDEF)-like protein